MTGAGTTSTREKLGNVINTVDSSLVRRSTEPQNIVNALAGKAPNVEVRWFDSPHDIPLFMPAEVASAIERIASLAAGNATSEAAAG